MLGNRTSVTRAEIEPMVTQVLQMENYNLLDRALLIREIESIYNVRVDDYRIITLEERNKPWLAEKRADISWGFWKRYSSYLQDEKGFPPDTLIKLNRLTDKILDSLFDPTENVQVDKKGLVVGQVQSGKTSNYTGLICKAADAGYKLIVVLAGIHSNLRSQTQLRIDEGFLGFDTQHQRAFNTNNIKIGVGKLGNANVAHSLTSSMEKGDFTQGAANTAGFNFNTGEPIVAVIKKNPHVLRRIYQWLSAQVPENAEGQRIITSKALLLIDDEADNASINISNDPERRSSINDWITRTLSLFSKSAYVGYTATPFANIFIPLEEDNLFPRDFIVNIPPPSNYIGPERVFGFEISEDDNAEDVLPIVNRIDDYSSFVPDRHKQHDQLPSFIPESLKLAVRCFILTCAVRRLRSQKKSHNSMLIHVSRFQRWQSHIKELVENQFEFYRRGIDQNDPDTLELFKKTYEEDSAGYRSYISTSSQILNSSLKDLDPQTQVHNWLDVFEHLNDAVSRIEIREVHGGSRDALDYFDHSDGLSVIAVGGNKLSRGLTLEGLSVSYYLRSSKMYDTLMQMGRWFGYRPGYVDLCRLFTSRELNEWFCHITHATDELRREFDYMSDVAGSTPEQYALKVRTHPGVLQISAANKMRTAITVSVSWAGRLVESYELQKDPETNLNNLNVTKTFISKLQNHSLKKGNYLWFDVPAEEVIDYLGGFKTVENMKAYDPQNLIQFISKQLSNNELTHWRVVLMNKYRAISVEPFNISGEEREIGLYTRTQDENQSDSQIYFIRKSHIISPDDEFIDLDDDEYERAIELTREHRRRNNKEGEPSYPNGEIVRNEIRDPKNPLLILYLLDPVESKTGMPPGTPPFVGFAISFPFSRFNNNITYAVHEQLLEKFNVVEEDFEDYGDED
jgi:hypothetical protein